MAQLKKRQKDILTMLLRLGGEASIRDIAKLLHLSVNGVSQSLTALTRRELVQYISGKGGDAIYALLSAV